MVEHLAFADRRRRILALLDVQRSSSQVRQLLAHAITTGLWSRDRFVAARLIGACAATRDIPLAELAFAVSESPTAFAHTALLRAISAGPRPATVFPLFRRMLRSGLYPDRFTFPFLLRACARCASTATGPHATTHALLLKHGLVSHPHSATALLHAYAVCDQLQSSLKVLDEMPEKTTVVWNAGITCCARAGAHAKGLALLTEMVLRGHVELNEDTVIAALACCTVAGAVARGKSVHALAVRRIAGTSLEVGASLIRMYAKCGSVDYANKVFDNIVVKDAATWTAMIGGLSMHGHGKEALELFDEMLTSGTNPDSQTFTSVLHACSHSGLVEIGIELFNSMKNEFGIEPRMEHYGAMVDMFGRASRIKEAQDIIDSMPFEPNFVVWGALLNACVVHGGSGFAERIDKELIGFEEGGFFVGLSNVYAKGERWEEVERLREKMADKGMRKQRGSSLVEVDGKLHKFLVRDTRHPLTREIYKLVNVLVDQCIGMC